jgi:hypothetical protein
MDTTPGLELGPIFWHLEEILFEGKEYCTARYRVNKPEVVAAISLLRIRSKMKISFRTRIQRSN